MEVEWQMLPFSQEFSSQWSVKELEQSIQVSALLPFGVGESFVVGRGLLAGCLVTPLAFAQDKPIRVTPPFPHL